MARRKFKDTIRFASGYVLERPTIDEPSDHAGEGSRNVLFTGQSEPEPFKGLTLSGGVGGISYSGEFGLAPAPPVVPPFDLENLGFSFVCPGGQFDTGPLIGDEVLLTHSLGNPNSQGAFSGNTSVTTNATVEFRFPTDVASSLVALRYSPVQDCATIENSVIDRGIEAIMSPSLGGVVKIGTRQPGAVWTTEFTEAWNPATVYKMVIQGSIVKIYKNGGLVAIADDLVTGDPLRLFIRLDQHGGSDAGEVGISLYTAGVVI